LNDRSRMNREIHVRICESVRVRFLGATRHNAVVERFFRSLKSEWIGEQEYGSHEQAQRDITGYIADFYNYRRIHSAANNLPPVRYENSNY
ncbi:IS3 family transposase, partial [Paraburkholderia mimosarum]|uniref:IS3 family transposase n=1 Tax=Paraburkholderia mimosarum TaxID=312026 RepID=UPI001FC809DF